LPFNPAETWGDGDQALGFVSVSALAISIDKVLKGERWIHEIKFDGYRVQLHIANETTTVFTRSGIDWTRRFKKIADDAFLINAASAVIDGEVVAPAADGTTDFSVLQNELKGKSTRIVMVAFDLLYLNGYDLRRLPLEERKSHLKKLTAKTAIQFSETFEVDGPEMYKHACSVGLEGVVSKVRDSRYPAGRGNDWVKKTCAQRETLPIAGFALKANVGRLGLAFFYFQPFGQPHARLPRLFRRTREPLYWLQDPRLRRRRRSYRKSQGAFRGPLD
jgi:bifunctional non-homologous end joining protein LigD